MVKSISISQCTVIGLNLGETKVVSDSSWLLDYAIGVVDSVLYYPNGQVKVFKEISNGHIKFQFSSSFILVKQVNWKLFSSNGTLD